MSIGRLSRRRTTRLNPTKMANTTSGSKSEVQQAKPQTIPAKMLQMRRGVAAMCQRSYSAVNPSANKISTSDWCLGRPNAVAQRNPGSSAEPKISNARPSCVNSRERKNIHPMTSPAQRRGEISAPAPIERINRHQSQWRLQQEN